jgi:PAS domain S-box-containing protein
MTEARPAPGPAAAGVAVPDSNERVISALRSELAESRRAEYAARRLASIVEASVDAVMGASLDGVITDWNPAGLRLYGYTAEEALGKSVSMLAPSSHAADVRALLARVAKGEFVENADAMRQRKDGTPIEVMMSLSPIRDDSGEVIGIAAIERDVTARRHDERTIAALHAVAFAAGHIMDAERLVALTTAQVRDAFGVDGLVIYWWDDISGMLRPIGGQDDRGLIPVTHTEHRPGEGLAGIVFQKREPLIVEDYAAWRLVHPRSKEGVGSAMAVPMYVGEQVVGVLAALAIVRRTFTEHDLQLLTRFATEVAPAIAVGQLLVDAQSRRDEALAAAARVSVYFRANPVPGFITRRAGNTFVDVNDAFVALLDRPRDALVGKSSLEVGVFADPDELVKLLATVDRGGQARGEVTLRTQSGELRSVLAFLEITEIAGEACLIVGCVDLTEQKRAAALDQQQQAILEEANRAKSVFLANMSHELRTPLNAILGFSELLREQLDLSDRHKSFLNNVHDAGRHLLELINDVLDISRVEAGKMELRRETIVLATLLEPVLATARLSAHRRRVRFDPAVIPSSNVSVDPTRVRQILDNLLSNAIKFTAPGGTVKLTMTVGNDELLIEVADTGVGIPASAHGRVFGTFERFHERMDGEPGTGLGLALTKALVELHGGTITFDSTVGVGTAFFVRLANTAPRVLTGARLLIVEDDRRDADLVIALAERRGLVANVVGSIAEAMAAIEKQAPSGIVLDLDLPDGRGEVILRELRKRNLRIPAVVVTALDEDPDIGLGVDDYLTKPIDAVRLDRWLDGFASQEEGRRSADPAR